MAEKTGKDNAQITVDELTEENLSDIVEGFRDILTRRLGGRLEVTICSAPAHSQGEGK